MDSKFIDVPSLTFVFGVFVFIALFFACIVNFIHVTRLNKDVEKPDIQELM